MYHPQHVTQRQRDYSRYCRGHPHLRLPNKLRALSDLQKQRFAAWRKTQRKKKCGGRQKPKEKVAA